MKLAEHVEKIRQLIDTSFRNRLGRMGITTSGLQLIESIPEEYHEDRRRIESIREVFIAETGSMTDAFEKLVEEFTFTLFNRLAALKVMEAHTLHPEIVTRRSQHGDRSFAHFLWLEQHPAGRNEEQEGLLQFMEYQLAALATDIPLFNLHHPYHLLPTVIELNGIIQAYNQVETDEQVKSEIWKSDDVLGWLYESYNNYKKNAHKESGAKTEFNKVSIQSQVYTPRWVVKFLVDNSLGKLYLEMFPDSTIKGNYKIANAPNTQTRDRKPFTEIRLIDPATGSGNFLLYGFDLFYALYIDQIHNYDAEYEEREIPELIIQHNLHGVDLDDRAVQLAQLGLYIKAKRRKRSAKIEHFNIVSSDFYLPDYQAVKHLFDNGEKLSPELERIVIDLWADLQQAHRFGSLIRLEEKFSKRLNDLEQDFWRAQSSLFVDQTLANYEQFRKDFFTNLQKAVAYNTEKQGLTFLNTKTSDAITFLQILTQKYDVAVANPPYTDSSDFGPDLKEFVDANYRQPYKFNANLYAVFIKRCYELINEKGKMALIHPLTFMYIKSFEDVRKFILEKTQISLFVDYGPDSTNVFDGAFASAPSIYVLEKKKTTEKAWFISLNQYTRTPQEKNKKDYCMEAINDYIENRPNKHNYTIDQSKLKIIKSWPFIYWISDGFRQKFKGNLLGASGDVKTGISSGDNERFTRYWWEIFQKSNILTESNEWKLLIKGGPYNKWYGNNWLVINWKNNGSEIKNFSKSTVRNEGYYFRVGISTAKVSSKGGDFRISPINSIFSDGAPTIIFDTQKKSLSTLSVLNTLAVKYIVSCLNPTVNTQVGDLQRIPFVKLPNRLEEVLAAFALENTEIKKQLYSHSIIEINFGKNPLTAYLELSLRDRLLAYLNYENSQLILVLLNEVIINQLIYEVYALSNEDREQVETKMGKPVGELPVLAAAREEYLSVTTIENEMVMEFIQNLTATTFDEQQVQTIQAEFVSLYQNNNDLEEFCIRHQLNPINVWYWFRESKVLPQGRAAEIALEYLADNCRNILVEDSDGIIPLVGLPGEPRLLERIEQQCFNQGFTSAQFMQLDGLLGRPMNEYIEHHFFKNLSDHLNLFMFLPRTPFIWHLSSGTLQGFEAYIIIYKWNRDSLYKLKTKYLGKRVESLEYRQIQLADTNTAQAQNEKESIRLQLQEIAEFTQKIDELIAEGYDPKLDAGVGKNIAPLQKKGMLRSEVLSVKQLEKYLKADW